MGDRQPNIARYTVEVTSLKSLPEDQGYIKPIQAEYHSCMLHSDEKPDQAENNNSFCFAAF